MVQNSQHSGGCNHFLFLCFPPDCMIMKETSVLKRSATENVCSSWIFNGHLLLQSLVLPTPVSFPFSSCWKMKEKGRGGEKKPSKQTPQPRLQIQTEKGATEVWMVWNTTAELAENVCTPILFENIWCCVCMDFSTFWINKNTKRGIQIWLFFSLTRE